MVWEADSMAQCLAMKLPCYNAAGLLPLPVNSSKQALTGSAAMLRSG